MKKKFFYIIGVVVLLVAVGLVVYFVPGSADDSVERMAYIDMQELFDRHPRRIDAESHLNELVQDMQKTLEEEAGDLPGEEQQEMLREYQEELSQKEQELVTDILEEIEMAVDKVAEIEEFNLIMEKRNVVYGGYDATEIVLNYIEENMNENVDNTDEG